MHSIRTMTMMTALALGNVCASEMDLLASAANSPSYFPAQNWQAKPFDLSKAERLPLCERRDRIAISR